MEIKIIFLIIINVILNTETKVLKQVVIISRHNVRTPLAKNLVEMTPKPWPNWKEKSGYLTEKGKLLEGYMGTFFSAWLKEMGLLPDGCPKSDEVFVYANSKQRTRASAQSFVDKAFPSCNVTVNHNDSDKNDPIFTPVIHNTSSIFQQVAKEEMQERLKSLQLNTSYENLEDILDYRDSEICKKNNQCDLVTDKNNIIDVVPGYKPNILGPLKIGNSVVDAFLMENYEGLTHNNVAWGQISNTKQWKSIMRLNKGYHNVIFNTTLIAEDIAKPLVKFMSDIFLNDNNTFKFVLLMGHDANLYTILKSMKFQPYFLPNQYETTPVGGKIVFQRWVDENNIDLLRIDYVYQSTKQMRRGIELSVKNPPMFKLLELEGCTVNNEGYCLWSDFKKILS